MDNNHKYLYKDNLDEYYRSLETIDSNYNELNNAKWELSRYQEKLQEGKQLVKSFGFSDQDVNNLPSVRLQKKTDVQQIDEILVSIKQTFETIKENERIIDDSTKQLGSYKNSNSSLSNKLEELANRKLRLIIINFIIAINAVFAFQGYFWWMWYVLMYLLRTLSVFTAIPFFLNIGKLREIAKEREKLETKIHELTIKANQAKHEIKQDEVRILELLSELNENTKLASLIQKEQAQQFERVWREQIAKIKEIMENTETSESPDIPPRLLTLNWDDPLWTPSENDPTHWQPQTSGLAPDIVRIGEFELDYDDKFAKFPAFLPIRDFSQELTNYTSGHIAFYSEDTNSRQTALSALQSIAFRIISSFPVRKLKGIFIDPIAMGNTFPFSNLHNFITDQKTYTRADDIREQLRGLTEHIEQVIQNYLSSNYATIEDYNFDAGAISEPYRYLFIADFPTGFDQRSLEDLKSILLNGPKAGVYVILHIDNTLEKPRNFDYQVFDDFCSIIRKRRKSGKRFDDYFFGVTIPYLESCRILYTLDQPPSNELFNSMTEAINNAIRNVRVDTIAFSKLYPAQDWLADSRKEIRAPIGLMGARDKLEFWLGENQDSQIVSHGLLAGATGSGKSFTLHASVISLAMQYSPDELELYLLDFKEGVEFQIYVDHEKGKKGNGIENLNDSEELNESNALPHAKVISIESDREFGLSVLEYVNQQIEERGNLFRTKGNISKLQDYRDVTGENLPRILVVIDEFQCMFEENDNITNRLNLVIDNITRQGRAFGIHLLLASQNPRASNMRGAIYTQINLRMVLQMDQNTASSVLAEGNTDAIDLLDKPGKLIYNKNFGQKNFNEIGQVADISAQERYNALTHIQNVAQQRQYQRSQPLVLFYGSKPTKLQDNRQLLQLMKMNKWLSLKDLNKQVIKEPDWIVQESPSVFWLGEPMRIGNHTKGIFRRRPRSNMLLVGNSEETIFGIIGGIIISLMHCYQPQKARFNIIDLSIEDEDNLWTEMTLNFRNNFDSFFPIKIAKRYGDSEAEIMKAETLLKETFEEFERRLKLRDENPDLNPNELGESLFFIYAVGGLNRAQNLRPVMGRRDEEPSEDAQKILKLISQGSEFGIHTILWLEDMKAFNKLSGNNRQWLGNFDLRVALTMPGEDSRLLLGEAVAEKLPRLRGYFKDESATVGLDKFKPYAVPTKAEIREYATNFNKRSE
ncbi:FtsK/SpoIIIE domain-containing protein [Geminocystis herdmanii]|uniref:FtsK/SpoIIIE domain-containing protein n=1 Tax=Geminocystis herdmanii TaxID=669359 RepID=UPI0003459782|nr:FtsK/SpoIIIE domain-containing protein [Geminocystis herdmanii]